MKVAPERGRRGLGRVHQRRRSARVDGARAARARARRVGNATDQLGNARAAGVDRVIVMVAAVAAVFDAAGDGAIAARVVQVQRKVSGGRTRRAHARKQRGKPVLQSGERGRRPHEVNALRECGRELAASTARELALDALEFLRVKKTQTNE